MSTQPPRPGESDGTDGSNPAPPEGGGGGGAGTTAWRTGLSNDEADRASRTYWESEADAYQAEHGAFLARAGGGVGDSDRGRGAGAGFVWGPEGVTEAELQMLGPRPELAGRRVLELGCGAAQCSAWLALRGVHAVGIDISVNQLRHAGHQQRREGGRPGTLHVVAATATALPFAGASFDAVVSAYGAVQFVADLPALLAEVQRVLVPGGRWTFSVTHPIRWAFPDEPGPEGLSVSGSYFDRTPYVERDASGRAVYAEFHRTLGDYVAALVTAGFSIDRIVEPEWPDWNEATWGGWSPLRGMHLPGTLIIGCRAGGGSA